MRLWPSRCGLWPERPWAARDLPVSVREVSRACVGSLTAPGRPRLAIAPAPCCLPALPTASAPDSPLSRLNTQPTSPLVNASPPPSRATAHDSGPSWLARPSTYGTCTTTPRRPPGARGLSHLDKWEPGGTPERPLITRPCSLALTFWLATLIGLWSYMVVSAPPPLSATDRFALIIEGLCRAVAAQSYREPDGGAAHRPDLDPAAPPGARGSPPSPPGSAPAPSRQRLPRAAAPRPARHAPPGVRRSVCQTASPGSSGSCRGGGLPRGAVAASLVRPGVRGPARRRAADGAGLAPALPDAGRRCLRSAAAASGRAGSPGRAPAPARYSGPDTAGPDAAGPDTSGHARRDAGAIAWPGAREGASLRLPASWGLALA